MICNVNVTAPALYQIPTTHFEVPPALQGEAGKPGVPGRDGVPGKEGIPGLPGKQVCVCFSTVNAVMCICGVHCAVFIRSSSVSLCNLFHRALLDLQASTA